MKWTWMTRRRRIERDQDRDRTGTEEKERLLAQTLLMNRTTNLTMKMPYHGAWSHTAVVYTYLHPGKTRKSINMAFKDISFNQCLPVSTTSLCGAFAAGKASKWMPSFILVDILRYGSR